MSSYGSEVEDVLSREFGSKVIYRAADDRDIPPQDYGSIRLEFENGVRAETDYVMKFEDDGEIKARFLTGNENRSFHLLEALSRGFELEAVHDRLYSDDHELGMDIETVLEDDGRLPEGYADSLSELLDAEIWG